MRGARREVGGVKEAWRCGKGLGAAMACGGRGCGSA